VTSVIGESFFRNLARNAQHGTCGAYPRGLLASSARRS
jgi:hypothetical protein